MARMTISELSNSDEGREFVLHVGNELGRTNYTIRLDNIKGESGLSTGAIVGIVIAVVFVIAIGGLVAFYVVKNKKKKRIIHTSPTVSPTARGPSTPVRVSDPTEEMRERSVTPVESVQPGTEEIELA